MKRLPLLIALLIASFTLGLAVPSGQVHAALVKALSFAGLPTTTQQVDISVIRRGTIPKGYACTRSHAATTIDHPYVASGFGPQPACVIDSAPMSKAG